MSVSGSPRQPSKFVTLLPEVRTAGTTNTGEGRGSAPVSINADGLIPEIECLLKLAKKTKALWAMRLDENQRVDTLEGSYTAEQGEYLCRGIAGEPWAQTQEKLLQKYTASGVVKDGWERYDPKPNAPAVEATAVDYPFSVQATWGKLQGKAGDYVVRDCSDPNDIWIVDKTIFESSYEWVEE